MSNATASVPRPSWASPSPPALPQYVLPFSEINLEDLPRVGGKNASLGEMIRALGPKGIRVPNGFAVTADAFRLHLRAAGLDSSIYTELAGVDLRDVAALAGTARSIRNRIATAPLPSEVAEQLRAAYSRLSTDYTEEATDVAVRSSATAEDLPTASFAGQQETYLNIRGFEALDRAVRGCMASLFTERAIVYRAERGIEHRDVALSVGVQKMVRSDLDSAGVIFTLDTESGFRDVVLITGAWGLGETVVQGRVRPDEFWVHKPTLRQGHRSIIRREIADKDDEAGLRRGEREDGARRCGCLGGSARRAVLGDDDVLTAGPVGARDRGPLLRAGGTPYSDGYRVGPGRPRRRAVHPPGPAGDGALPRPLLPAWHSTGGRGKPKSC